MGISFGRQVMEPAFFFGVGYFGVAYVSF